MSTKTENATDDNAAITAAAVAGDAAKASGGGDIAVYNAQRDALRSEREGSKLRAKITHDAAIQMAATYGPNKAATAQRMVANAERDYATALVDADSSYHRRLDEFAVSGGFLNLVNGDAAVAIVGRRLDSAVRSLVETFELARTVGDGTHAATPSGANFTIAEMIALLQPTQSDPGTVTETVAA